MKIVVCVKQVAVLGDEVEFTGDAYDVDPDYLDFALNEWDSYATEEALRIREELGGEGDEVVVVSVGDAQVEDAMRRCLAMGADRGIRVDYSRSADPITVARLLAPVAQRESPDLIFCGVQSSDGVQAATGTGAGWVAVQRGGEVVGQAGSLEADSPVWAAPLFGFEVRLETALRDVAPYRPLPTQPPVERDVALLLPAGVTAAAVAAVLGRAMGPLLERLEVFDEYRGAGVPAGQRSVAWHCTFRDPTRTLREREVDELLARGLKALEDELGVRRREG